MRTVGRPGGFLGAWLQGARQPGIVGKASHVDPDFQATLGWEIRNEIRNGIKSTSDGLRLLEKEREKDD
eukprot:5490247-Pyramimonas_sp.AAC.1